VTVDSDDIKPEPIPRFQLPHLNVNLGGGSKRSAIMQANPAVPSASASASAIPTTTGSIDTADTPVSPDTLDSPTSPTSPTGTPAPHGQNGGHPWDEKKHGNGTHHEHHPCHPHPDGLKHHEQGEHDKDPRNAGPHDEHHHDLCRPHKHHKGNHTEGHDLEYEKFNATGAGHPDFSSKLPTEPLDTAAEPAEGAATSVVGGAATTAVATGSVPTGMDSIAV
jgi:hypothetical protein